MMEQCELTIAPRQHEIVPVADEKCRSEYAGAALFIRIIYETSG
jgi:hypothetical protein